MFQVKYTNLALLKKLDKYQSKEAVSVGNTQSTHSGSEHSNLKSSQCTQFLSFGVGAELDDIALGSNAHTQFCSQSVGAPADSAAQFRLLERSRMIVKLVPW